MLLFQATMRTAKTSTERKIATSAPGTELYEMVQTGKLMLYFKGLLQEMVEPAIDMANLTASKLSVRTGYSPIPARYRYITALLDF